MQQEEEDLSKELTGVLNEFRTLEDVQEDWQRRRDNPARRKGVAAGQAILKGR